MASEAPLSYAQQALIAALTAYHQVPILPEPEDPEAASKSSS